MICENVGKIVIFGPGEEFAGWGKPGGYSLHCEQVQVFAEFSKLNLFTQCVKKLSIMVEDGFPYLRLIE